jgi:hypothetical protein
MISYKLYHLMIRTTYPATVVGEEKLLSQAKKNVSSITHWLIIFPKCHVTKLIEW